MEFLLIDKDERVDYYPQLLDMLSLADNEFVPPLSARTSTTQSRFSCSAELTGGVLEYFEELKKQNLFIATENKRVLGFVSFKENYTCNIIGGFKLYSIAPASCIFH